MATIKTLHIMRNFSRPSETFIYDLVCGLAREKNIANKVLCYKTRELADERPFEPVYEGKTIEQGNLSVFERVWLRFKKSKRLSRKALCQFLQKESPDLIHCHFAWTLSDYIYPVCLEWNKKIPIIVSTHGSDITKDAKKKSHRIALLDVAQQKHAYFTATTNYLSSELEALGIPTEKIRIIPNAVHPAFFNQRKQVFFKRGECFRLINNARLVPWKGHIYLLEAFARFIQEVYANATLTLIGSGELREFLETEVERLGIAGQVQFLGNIAHEEIPEILARHDLYIQPSIIDEKTGQLEAFGVAVLEAIATGLPVIVTNTGGLPYVIGEENSFAHLVPDKDADALFEKIKMLFTCGDAFRDNDVYARERVAYYSQENQRKACTDLYEEALRGVR